MLINNIFIFVSDIIESHKSLVSIQCVLDQKLCVGLLVAFSLQRSDSVTQK